MNASYELRLLLQCLNSFFAVYLLLSIAVYFMTPLGVWCAERISPAAGARVLWGMRILPLAAGLYAAIAITLPSYLRLEPEMKSERIGIWALSFAALGIACWVRPLSRSIAALRRSSRFFQYAQHVAQPLRCECNDVWIVTERAPHIAVAGLLHPRVFLSESAAALFSPDELKVVLLHECAHQRSRDNLKRLLLLLLPDAFPFFNFMGSIERALKRLVEWAADDYASGGDSGKSVALARALVCFARHQTNGNNCVLATSLIDDNPSDLARRVERLLGHSQPTQSSPPTYLTSAALAIAILGTALHFADLPNVHRLLELLSR